MTRLLIHAAAVMTAIGLATAAPAQTFDSGATIIGPDGKTTTVDRSVTRGNGQVQGTVNVQRADGRGYTRSFNQSRSNGVVNRQGTATTNRGRSYARDAQRTCSNGVCSGGSVVTGPNGRQWTRNYTYRRTGPGQWEGEVSRTGPRGRQTTTRRWFQVRPRP